jgi:hypothetical protein
LPIFPIFTLCMFPYGALINFLNSFLGLFFSVELKLEHFQRNARGGIMTGFCFSYKERGDYDIFAD